MWTLARVALLLACVASLSAQESAPQPAPFTDVEALRVENVRLEGVVLQMQITGWQAKRDRLKAELEQSRPGWSWNPETGQWTATPKK